MKNSLFRTFSCLLVLSLFFLFSFDVTGFVVAEETSFDTVEQQLETHENSSLNTDHSVSENQILITDETTDSSIEDILFLDEKSKEPSLVDYTTHIESIGWQEKKSDGETAGTNGRSLRLEAIAISLGNGIDVDGGIQYRSHIQNIGWEDKYHQNGEMSGTQGQSLRLEAIQIELIGEAANQYDVYYRVHVQNIGWLDWACNGEYAGSSGYGYRLEAVEILLYSKDDPNAPQKNNNSYCGINGERNYNYVTYQTHIQNVGWQTSKYDGCLSGTEGQSLRLESIKINKGDYLSTFSGDIQYRVHIENLGWEEGWHSNGEISGTTGKSYRLEAIQIQTTESIAENFDVYYRVHVQNYGWLDWACNGEEAGSEGYSLKLEAIQILLLKKGSEAPGKTETAFVFNKMAMINNALSSLPKHLETYYTADSTATLIQLEKKAKDPSYIQNLNKTEINALILQMYAAAELLEYKCGTSAPIVYVSTDTGTGNQIGKENGYISTNVAIVETNGKTLEESGNIKVRGNSTAQGEKKPFTIKFDSKQNVLGMGKAKKWALLANLYDPTGLRNAVAFDLAQEMGLAYTSEYQFVELYVDGVYKGLYLLAEPVEEGSSRVDIDSDNGDFLIEREARRTDDDVIYIRLDCGLRFAINEPEEPTDAQLNQIKTQLNQIVSIMQNGTYAELSSVVDIDSFSKFYIFNELMKTVDFNYSSTRFYFKDGKLYAGPVWDYDLSCGNTETYSDDYHVMVAMTDGNFVNNYNLYAYMFNHPEFVIYSSEVYKTYYPYISNIYADNGLIDNYINTYHDIIQKNNAIWNPSKQFSSLSRIPESTYEGNVQYLKDWLNERNTWMNSYFNQDMDLLYYTHVSNLGWTVWQSDGATGGTTGQGLPLEAIRINLSDDLNGGISYRSYVRGKGWENNWKDNNELSGTTGLGLPIEAIQIKLNGILSTKYDVTYQVHISGTGWTEWVSNGEPSGVTDSGQQIEAIRIKLVTKK